MQQNRKSVGNNIILNTIFSVSLIAFPLISYPYISRVLGPGGIGKVSLAISIATYFNMFAQLGIPTYGIRLCAKVRDDKEKLSKIVTELLMINIVCCIFMYIAFFIFIFYDTKIKDEKALYIVVSSMIFFNAIGMEWLFQGLEQFEYMTKRSIFFKFIALIAMFIFVHEKNDFIIYAFLSTFAISASDILNFFYARKYVKFAKVKECNYKRHFKSIGIFFAMSCANTVYTYMDTIMLGYMTNDKEVGYYNNAIKIKIALASIITAVGNVLLPHASYYIEKNLINEYKQLTQKALNFVIIFSVPIVVYFTLFASYTVYIVSGIQFENSIIPMQIIMPTIIFIGITNIIEFQILMPTGKEKIVMYSVIAGAIVDMALNAVLIPSMRSEGAAYGTLIAEIVVFVIQYISLKPEISSYIRNVHYVKILISLIFASVISVFTKQIEVPYIGFQSNNILIMVISFLCFFLIYILSLVALRETYIIELKTIIRKTINNRCNHRIEF